jgi:hypothetical protein
MTINTLSSILLGKGQTYLDFAGSYYNELGMVLGATKKIHYSTECSLNTQIAFQDSMEINSLHAIEKLCTEYSLEIKLSFLQADQRLINILLGKDSSSSSFYIIPNTDFTSYFRLELVFTYPNNINSMQILFPKTQIISTNGLDLYNNKEPHSTAITFQSFPVRNATWDENLGRVTFA